MQFYGRLPPNRCYCCYGNADSDDAIVCGPDDGILGDGHGHDRGKDDSPTGSATGISNGIVEVPYCYLEWLSSLQLPRKQQGEGQ